MSNSRRLLLLLLALFAAAVTAAQPLRMQAGDRLRVRADGGTVTITGALGDSLIAPVRASRSASDPRLVELTAPGDLRVSVPRGVIVETISSGKAVVQIAGVAAVRIDAAQGHVLAERINGNVDAESGTANVTLRDIGGNVVVKTGNGNITADRITGLVDITSGNGKTVVTNARSGVHLVTINGKSDVSCVGGSVTVRDTSSQIIVSSVAGDVDLFSPLGRITYVGALIRGRSYRLRTVGGAAELQVAAGSAGFTGRLASDGGAIDLDPLFGTAGKNRRIDVRSGDESARVLLDAVDGRVVLRRAVKPFRISCDSPGQ